MNFGFKSGGWLGWSKTPVRHSERSGSDSKKLGAKGALFLIPRSFGVLQDDRLRCACSYGSTRPLRHYPGDFRREHRCCAWLGADKARHPAGHIIDLLERHLA